MSSGHVADCKAGVDNMLDTSHVWCNNNVGYFKYDNGYSVNSFNLAYLVTFVWHDTYSKEQISLDEQWV